jgi:hypothetical protein
MRLLATLLMAFYATFAFANTNQKIVDSFNKQFKIKRDAETGEAVAVKARLISAKFNLKNYINAMKEELKSEQKTMLTKGAAHKAELDAFIAGLDIDDKSQEDVENVIRQAFKGLLTVDVDATFKTIDDSGFFAEFAAKLREALQSFDFTIVGKMNDARFFYRKRAAYRVVTWALDFARKRFSSIPILNTVSFIIVKFEKLIREQRTYYQNMILYYLDNVSHTELGMSKAEADHLFSSIFESRIPWSNIWESNAAAESWNRYGTDIFYRNVRSANTRYRDLIWGYRSVGGKLAYSFAEVTGEKGKMIVNLVDRKHMFSGKPAVAYYYDNPKKITRDRLLMNVAQIAVSFVPVTDSLKNMFNQFVNSFYERQKLTEGALSAYLAINGRHEQARTIVLQSINPFFLRQ